MVQTRFAGGAVVHEDTNAFSLSLCRGLFYLGIGSDLDVPAIFRQVTLLSKNQHLGPENWDSILLLIMEFSVG